MPGSTAVASLARQLTRREIRAIVRRGSGTGVQILRFNCFWQGAEVVRYLIMLKNTAPVTQGQSLLVGEGLGGRQCRDPYLGLGQRPLLPLPDPTVALHLAADRKTSVRLVH